MLSISRLDITISHHIYDLMLHLKKKVAPVCVDVDMKQHLKIVVVLTSYDTTVFENKEGRRRV